MQEPGLAERYSLAQELVLGHYSLVPEGHCNLVQVVHCNLVRVVNCNLELVHYN